jgi:hypothetical protein
MNAFSKTLKILFSLSTFEDVFMIKKKKPFADLVHPVRMIEERSHGIDHVVHVMEVRVDVCGGGKMELVPGRWSVWLPSLII